MVRSAMAPETMVAVVAQKTRLNTKLEKSKLSYAVNRSKPGLPMNPSRSSPISRLKPMRIKTTVPMQKSIRFFMMILPVFLARVKPASTMANPACIQKTNAAPIRYHTLHTSLILLPPFFTPYRASFCFRQIPGDRNGGQSGEIFQRAVPDKALVLSFSPYSLCCHSGGG